MNYLFDEETKQQLRQTVNDPKLIRLLDMTKDELSKIELTHVSLESYDISNSFLNDGVFNTFKYSFISLYVHPNAI